MNTAPASDTTCHALRGLGFKASATPGTPASMDVMLAPHTLLCAVIVLPPTDRVGPMAGVVARSSLRVGIKAASALGLTGAQVDAWLAQQEPALGVLVQDWQGMPPPFPGRRLRIHTAGGDPLHHETTSDGKWRLSRWLVCEA